MRHLTLLIARWIILLLLVLPLTQGCSRLTKHPKHVVAIPSTVGAGIGLVVGIPIGFVIWLGYLPHLALSSDFKMESAPYYGACVPSYIVATLIGGPVWLVDGWWGIDDPDDQEKYGTFQVFVPDPLPPP